MCSEYLLLEHSWKLIHLVSAFPIPVTYWQRETTSVSTVSVPKTDAFCTQSPHPVRGAVTDIDAMTIPIRLMVPVRAVPHHAVSAFLNFGRKN